MREYFTTSTSDEGEGDIEDGQQQIRKKKVDILTKILVAAQENQGEAYQNVNAHK